MSHLPIRHLLAILTLALLGGALPVFAQEYDRELHWRRMDVQARLDTDGRLRVRERQAIVFTGDWNGGERTFNIRPGQRLELHGITRTEPGGTPRSLEKGDLDGVDHYAFTDATTLRWRSRLPSDPIFVNREIIYELDYTLSNILIPEGDEYRLDHDFAFPARSGIIEKFTLDLAAENVWQSTTPLPLRLERDDIEPGASVVVTLPLRYTGAGVPAGVQRGLSASARLLLALLLVTGLGWMLRSFYAEEGARGRFAPLMPEEDIDEAWLREHVFSMPPEVVGAIWDNTTSAPEVAAMIARMVLEGKLASRVDSKGWKHVLHLELKVPKADLVADERRLVNALFSGDSKTTDTERIKKRYRSSGFDPAGLISDGIQKRINALSPKRSGPRDRRTTMINVAVVLMVIAAGVVTMILASGSIVLMAPIVVGVTGFIALVMAGVYRANVIETRPRALRMTVFLLLASAPVLALILGLFEHGAAWSLTPAIMPAFAGLPLVVALLVVVLGIAHIVLQAARTSEDAERLELRRTLAAGRSFFMRELRQQQPSLDDAWYPYLLAFGLGRHVDKWFRAFGAPAHSMSSAGMAVATTSSSGGWSGGGPLFGGGGGFGGGGTGRTWAASVATLSAGVSAPSSSSSSGGGGGGGGGGSSGGGGGGGW